MPEKEYPENWAPQQKSLTRIERLREKGFFRYMGRSVLLIISVYGILLLLVYLSGKHLVDFSSFFGSLIDKLPDTFVLPLFFVSESFTGLIPVDLFVIWAQKFEHPLQLLSLLGLLSYVGAILSYGIGSWISGWPKTREFTERKLDTYIRFVRKWGGSFIVIAALFPFTPFSLVVIALSLLKYPFRLFLLYGLARLIRFVIQGMLFFDLLNVDAWFAQAF
jgi:hypothetical protein